MTKFTHGVRVLHPVDAVEVAQVRVPLLVVVTGVRRLLVIGCGGGVHCGGKKEEEYC